MEASVMAGSLLTHMPTHRSTLPELLPPTYHCQRPNNRLSSLFVRNPTPSIGIGLRGRMSPAVFCSTEGALKVEEQVPIEKRMASFPSVMDINKIRETLPHRFPFLLVDRVIEHQFGISAVGIKNVTINENFFPGHFPEWPIMPGVLIVEAMAQVGGIMLLQPEAGFSRTNFVFAGIDKVRFRKPVTPGDTLVMRVKLLKFNKAYGLAKMEGKAFVGGEVVCEGELLLASVAENK